MVYVPFLVQQDLAAAVKGAYALNVEISTGGTATASVTGTGITAATICPKSLMMGLRARTSWVRSWLRPQRAAAAFFLQCL